MRLLPGILVIAIAGTACGRGDGPEISTIEPPPEATAPLLSQQPVAEPAKGEVPKAEAGSRPALGAGSPRPAATQLPAVPEYREFTLPAGTTLVLELRSTIASDVSNVDDAVCATLRRTVTIDGEDVLPAGTELAGHVSEVERAGRVKGLARVAFRFTSLRHDGAQMSLQTDSIVHKAEATKGDDAAKIGIGAGAGAVIGAFVGGESGAAKGALVGGAAGTGAVMATRGKDVRLESGTEIRARLAMPLAIRVRVH